MARDTMALDHAIVGAQSRRQPREVSMDALSDVLKAQCTSGGIPLDGRVRRALVRGFARRPGGLPANRMNLWLCQTATNPAPAAVAALTPLCPPAGTVTGTVGAANVIGPSTQLVAPGELDEVIRALRAGYAYGNVHSSAAPGGEIRGQLH